MAKRTTILELFVASPSDVAEERKLLEDVLAEFNLVWGDAHGVRLELKAWETDTRPAIGVDAQDVINTQIGDSYDIFIGIMWGKFGMPTGRAGSGTEEEFERAFRRYRDGKGVVQIMFYFKNAPISPNDIEPAQLEKVQSFKKNYSAEYGGLYHEFVASEDFRKLVRIHLSKLVQDTLTSASPAIAEERIREPSNLPVQPLAHFSAISDEDDEEGIIDLNEAATTAMSRASDIVQHINSSITELGSRIGLRTTEFTALHPPSTVTAPDPKLIKRLADGAAGDMDLYVQRMTVDLPALHQEYSLAMEKFGRLAMLSGADLKEPENEIVKTLDALTDARAAITTTVESVRGMRDTMAATPRLTSVYNRARRRAVAVTDDFLAFLDTASSQTFEVEQALQRILSSRRT